MEKELSLPQVLILSLDSTQLLLICTDISFSLFLIMTIFRSLFFYLLYCHWVIPKPTRPSLDLRSSSAVYDIVVTHALEWPSLTADWLPNPLVDEEQHTIVHNLVLGTHSGEGAENALLLANVTLPLPSAGWDDVKVNANSKL